MKAASESLFRRYLRQLIETPTGIKGRKFRWGSGVTYHEDEGWLKCTLTKEIMPHVACLSRKFTSYLVRQTTELRSVYTWRILEMFTSFLDANDETKAVIKIINMENLRHTLEAPKSYRYLDIRRRVIEPAIKELTKKRVGN